MPRKGHGRRYHRGVAESEFDGLSEWVQKNAKPPSPEPSPIRPDQVFKNPIVDGKEFVQREQPPVDPMEGMVPAERARLNPREWRHLNYADIDDLVRVLRQSSVIDYFRIATILRSWLDALQWYYENQLLQGSFSDLRWSSGSARGKVDISCIITHNLLPGSAEGVVERNTSMSDGARGLRLWTTTLSFAQRCWARCSTASIPRTQAGPCPTHYCQSSRHKTSLA